MILISLFQWLCVLVPGKKGAAKVLKVRYQQGLVIRAMARAKRLLIEQKMRFLL